MIFPILTLLSALALAGVAAWFSIIGIITIYSAAAYHATIMGIVLEASKLVTASWLYRNWQYSGLLLKIPLIFFTALLMLITSIGIYGFLSKAHLEQGVGTVDNRARIERLQEQIDRENLTIQSAQRSLDQLDRTLDAYLQNDRIDRSVVIRQRQAAQRSQLAAEISRADSRINELNEEKFKLESEIRALELEVGPIKYIAQLFFSGEEKDIIEQAVRLFTLMIVLAFDPLAVTLLIAANHTIMRLKNEKENKEVPTKPQTSNVRHTENVYEDIEDSDKAKESEKPEQFNVPNSQHSNTTEKAIEIPEVSKDKTQRIEIPEIEFPSSVNLNQGVSYVRSPVPTSLIKKESTNTVNNTTSIDKQLNTSNDSVIRELIGSVPHFTPKPVIDRTNSSKSSTSSWISKFGDKDV